MDNQINIIFENNSTSIKTITNALNLTNSLKFNDNYVSFKLRDLNIENPQMENIILKLTSYLTEGAIFT